MNWFAFYTQSRAEKATVQRLKEQGIEAYIPLHTVIRQWSDRKKKVEVPLINGYVFARPDPSQYFQVLNTQGIVRCVWFCGKPAPIPDAQIRIMQALIDEKTEVEASSETFLPGEQVQFTQGALTGVSGELIQISGKHKVILRIDHISHSLLVTADPCQLAKVQKKTGT